MVRESESSRHSYHSGRRLQHDHYTGPWGVTEVLQTDLGLQVTMRGTKQRTRNESSANVKLPPTSDLETHSVADVFAQYA